MAVVISLYLSEIAARLKIARNDAFRFLPLKGNNKKIPYLNFSNLNNVKIGDDINIEE